MDAPHTTSDPASPAPPSRGTILDRRPVPRGGLPRHVQTWLMVGIALVILGVILVTGRREPSLAVPSIPGAIATGTISQDRVRDYQTRLAEQEARARQELAAPLPVATETASLSPPVVPRETVDPLDDERHRRDYESLFAENVAFTRRSTAAPPATTSVPGGSPVPFPWALPVPVIAPSPAPPSEGPEPNIAVPPPPPSTPPSRAAPSSSETAVPRHTMVEGTVIETVLMNRLDGTFQGPVQCLVTSPVYSQNRQVVLVPAGARVLGSAAPVQAWGDTRLAVTFHRLLMPDGQTYALDSFTGLNQVGETGLRDEVDRHYLQVFGASLAIGAIAGLGQYGTRGGFDASFPDAARQSAGASLATSTGHVLDRYLNVLPTVTIREGHRIKVVLTNDLALPAYADTDVAPAPARPISAGGSR